MEQTGIGEANTITLWRPTGQAELDLVAASGWRAWPPRLPDQPIFYPVLNRWYATKIAREWNAPAGGVGYVTRFEVRRAHLDRYEVQQVGGRDVLEYWIPAEELADLNANIVGAIIEEAEYRGLVGDEEFTLAEHALGRALPAAWRNYLQGQSWFRRGWMMSGAYVCLNTPREMLELHDAWEESIDTHHGIAIIGGDGSREQLVLDLRHDPAPVLVGRHHQQRMGQRDPPSRSCRRAHRTHRGRHLRVQLRRIETTASVDFQDLSRPLRRHCHQLSVLKLLPSSALIRSSSRVTSPPRLRNSANLSFKSFGSSLIACHS